MTNTAEWRVPELSRGGRMALARETAGYTQEAMAAALRERGIKIGSKQTVSNWEKDANQPRDFSAVIEVWAELTRAPREWLMWGIVPANMDPTVASLFDDSPVLALVPSGADPDG